MASRAKMLLRQPAFRALLTTRLLIVFANQISSVAIGWRVYELTHDPLWLGYVGLAEAIPAISLSLYAGHVADNNSRQRMMRNAVVLLICCLAIRTIFGSGFLGLELPIQLFFLFGSVVLDGVARSFFGPAFSGIQTEVIAKPDLADASSMLSGSWQTAAVIGPALGGLLYTIIGPSATFGFSLVLAIGCLFVIGKIPVLPAPFKEVHLPIMQSIQEGLKFVFSSQIILGAITLDLFAVLFGGAVAMLPVFSDQILHAGPTGLGILRAAPSVGAVLMATFFFGKGLDKWHFGRTLLIVVAGFGVCMIIFGMSENFWISLAALACSGALDHISIIIRKTISQSYTPNAMRGRVSAVENMFIVSSNEIGEFESGITASWWGLQRSVVIGGLMSIGVVGFVSLLAPNLRKLKQIEL